MPQMSSEETDLLCSDVRVLESLVLAEDGSATFGDDANGINLSLPVGMSMNDFLNGALEVAVNQSMSSTPAAIVHADDTVHIQQAHKVKTPSTKRTPRKLLEAVPSFVQNESGSIRKISIGEDNANMLIFEQWLASVTEQINQSMHYGMAGTPAPLVYTIPHSFFDCLRERLSSTGGRKKRLPNSTVVFQRNDRPPFATLTRYTWHLTNALHVKQIFDTSTVSYIVNIFL